VAACLGFIEGFGQRVLSEAAAWRAQGYKWAPSYCIPTGVTKGPVVQVVMRYLQANPAQLHLDASDLVYFALGTAFLCAK